MTAAQAAALFRALAARLDANPTAPFGGAFLVVPPASPESTMGGPTPDSPPIDGVFLTNNPSPAVFWSSVSGQVEIAIATLQAQTQQGGYAGRR